MVPEQSKWLIALKSAARALIPIILAAAALISSGAIKIESLATWKGVYALLLALAGKGVLSGETAKDVTVKT